MLSSLREYQSKKSLPSFQTQLPKASVSLPAQLEHTSKTESINYVLVCTHTIFPLVGGKQTEILNSEIKSGMAPGTTTATEISVTGEKSRYICKHKKALDFPHCFGAIKPTQSPSASSFKSHLFLVSAITQFGVSSFAQTSTICTVEMGLTTDLPKKLKVCIVVFTVLFRPSFTGVQKYCSDQGCNTIWYFTESFNTPCLVLYTMANNLISVRFRSVTKLYQNFVQQRML